MKTKHRKQAHAKRQHRDDFAMWKVIARSTGFNEAEQTACRRALRHDRRLALRRCSHEAPAAVVACCGSHDSRSARIPDRDFAAAGRAGPGQNDAQCGFIH